MDGFAPTPAYADLYRQICEEWNNAEADVKQAEQICHEVVIPSITELRYAGRRLIQALELMSKGGDPDRVRSLLQDAWFNCHRARHDAVDAATAQMALTTEAAVKKLGYNAILAAFPDFPKLVRAIHETRAKIVASRGSATERDGLYETIEASALPNLVAMFNHMQAAEPMMIAMARKERRNNALAVGGIILGGLGLIVSLYFGWWPSQNASSAAPAGMQQPASPDAAGPKVLPINPRPR